MNNLYSVTRPNQGKYFISAGDDKAHKQPCAKSGSILSKRIGHNISNNQTYSQCANNKKKRLYNAENDTCIVTDLIGELQRRLFPDKTVDEVLKAAQRRYPIDGWLIQVDNGGEG